MSGRCALLFDSDAGFCDMLRGALDARQLPVVSAAEWSDEVADGAEPAVVVVAVEAPDKAGYGICAQARARWPGVPIALATSSLSTSETELHAATSSELDAYLDKRTLTRDELAAKLEALVGSEPRPSEAGPASAPAPAERPPESGGRVAELEEEVRHLRFELEATRSAAQSAPSSKGFLRLSEVVAVKEREIVRLKKEIFAREHKIAAGGRTAREASSRASAAAREREADQAEMRRLRLEIQRLTAESEQALASLSDERRQHEETRRQHGVTLGAHADVLKQVQDDQLVARSAVEAQLREEHGHALASTTTRWKTRLRRLRRSGAHTLALVYDQLRDQQLAHERTRAAQDDAQRTLAARAAEELAAVRAGAERQRDELQRLHELSLAEALAGHAAAERRAEELRSARGADAERFEQERLRSVAASSAEWEGKLDELRRAHADAVGVLRRHFQEQLGAAVAAAERQAAERQKQHDAALQGAADENAGTRMQAARLDQQSRERHEAALLEAQARHAEELRALTERLRGEERQALAAAVAEWSERLDALRREHAESFDALRGHAQQQLQAQRAMAADTLAGHDQAHAAALQAAAQELAAARADAARLEHEAREREEREHARLMAEHAEALASLELRRQADRDHAVGVTVAAWEQKLEELRRAHAGSIETLRRQYQDLITELQTSREQELVRTRAEHQAELQQAAAQVAALRSAADAEREEARQRHEQALAELAIAHADARTRADREQRTAQRAAEAALRDEQERTLAALAADWEGRLEGLRQAHATAVEAQRAQAREQLETLQGSLAQELAKRSDEHRAALARLQEQSTLARSEAARTDHETRQRYELALGALESEHRTALADLDARLHAQLDQGLAESAASAQARLDELQAAHTAALEAHRQEHDELVRALRAEQAETLARKEGEHEAALQRLEQELAEARSRRPEARPRTDVPAPAAQAEALRALEARLVEEKERALADVAAEWKAKMDRLRRGHVDSLAALRREHQEHVAALEGARQQAASKQRPLPFGDTSDKVVPIKAGGERSR